MSVAREFKKFAVKGNAIDMAVGIVVGASFTKIVNSLVNDIILPPIGLILGGTDFPNLVITLKPAVGEDPAVVLRYGMFINSILDFFIIALSIFVVVKGFNSLKKKENTI